jgi:DNA-binding transcriptional LysR family regulator
VDIYQLRTFVVVAREGSVTRASEVLHLSQPAVSAHIKTMEDGFGLNLFERTPRGMSLTQHGQRLLSKAELTLAAHQELMDEASRNKGEVTGKLRLGAGSNSNNEAIGKLLTGVSERHPGIEVTLKHGASKQNIADLRNGILDACFYNEPDEPEPDLVTIEVSQFKSCVVAAPGVATSARQPDWKALADLPWIYPASAACCGRTAEELFKANHFKPKRIVSVDRQDVAKTLIVGGIGVGLLHSDIAIQAKRSGDVEILFEAQTIVRVLFAYLASRKLDPVLQAAASVMRGCDGFDE